MNHKKKIYLFAYTDDGRDILREIKTAWNQTDIELEEGNGMEIRAVFDAADTDALVFIGAAGIAVRTVAPYLKSKLTDPAVLVMDVCGRYVIPVLSGHYGGANQLAREFARLIGAEPVITTATDLHGIFAVDVFAKQNGCYIAEPEYIKKISAAVLRGERIGISSEFPVAGEMPPGLQWAAVRQKAEAPKIGFHIGYQKIHPFFTTLHLMPKDIVVGIGCRKGKSKKELREFLSALSCRYHFPLQCIAALASIDRKAREQGILELAEELRVPFLVYSAEQLGQAAGDFTASEFVARQMGVDNVCERSAAAAAGSGAVWICKKQVREGMTLAAVRKKVQLLF